MARILARHDALFPLKELDIAPGVAALARRFGEILPQEKKRLAMGAKGPAIAAEFERKAQIARYADGLKELAGESS